MKKINIFFLDSLGALISALTLGVIFPTINCLIGMPVGALYSLALCALAFSIYSLPCYHYGKTKDAKWLFTLALLNTLYCFISISLIIYHYNSLTTLGLSYFISEKIAIFILIYLECKEVSKLNALRTDP